MSTDTYSISSDLTALLSSGLVRISGHFAMDRSSNTLTFHNDSDETGNGSVLFTDRLAIKTVPMISNNVTEISHRSYRNPKSVAEHAAHGLDYRWPGIEVDGNKITTLKFGEATLFEYSSLWTIPPSTELKTLGRYRWNLAIQKLLSLTEQYISIIYNPRGHYNFATEDNELDDSEYGVFVTFLKSWKCESKINIYYCIQELLTKMHGQMFIDKHDSSRIKDWLELLSKTGYKWPKRKYFDMNDVISNTIIRRRVDYDGNLVKSFPGGCGENYIPSLYRSVFHNSTFYRKFSNVVLIIEFNFPNFKGIKYIDFLYRSMFEQIIYCGPKSDMKTLEGLGVDFVSYDSNGGGFLFYSCLSIVMQMNLQVEGYMLISDDLLLNPEKIEEFNLNNPIMFIVEPEVLGRPVRFNITSLKYCNENMYPAVCNIKHDWMWPREYRKKTRRVQRQLLLQASKDDVVLNALRNLKHNAGGDNIYYGEFGDAAYVPKRHSKSFVKVASFFLKEKIFVEIALPTIMHMLSRSEHIQYVRSLQLPMNINRNKPWKRWEDFMNKYAYIHPTKWGTIVTENDKWRLNFYCTSVLPFYLKYLQGA